MRRQRRDRIDGPVKLMPAIEHTLAPRLRDRQSVRLGSLGDFLRARPELLREWMLCRQLNFVVFCAVAIVIGAGVYGMVMGSWRGSWQALYTGMKLPLAILLTTLGNGLLNGMLAPLLG